MRRPAFSIIFMILILGLLTNESANQPPPPVITIPSTPSSPSTCSLPDFDWNSFNVNPVPSTSRFTDDNEIIQDVAEILYPDTLLLNDLVFGQNSLPLFVDYINQVEQERSDLTPFIDTMHSMIPESSMEDVIKYFSRHGFPFGLDSTVRSVTNRVRNLISGIPSGEYLRTTLRNIVVDSFRRIGINLLPSNEEFQSFFQITPEEAWSMIVAWVLDCKSKLANQRPTKRPRPLPSTPPSIPTLPPNCPLLPYLNWDPFIIDPKKPPTTPTPDPRPRTSRDPARNERVRRIANTIYPESLEMFKDLSIGGLVLNEYARYLHEIDHERSNLRPFMDTINRMVKSFEIQYILRAISRQSVKFDLLSTVVTTLVRIRSIISGLSGDFLREALENIVLECFRIIGYNIPPSNQVNQSNFQITQQEAFAIIMAWVLDASEDSFTL